MPREKQFDDDAVLECAADVFAANGYQGTSLSMLLEATGLGKQSLYNSFGDKRSLYLQAVDCAAARYGAVQREMQRAVSGRAAVQVFFEHLLGYCASRDPARRSCIVSAGLLEGVDDPLIAQRLREKWAGTHEVLRAAVERGQKDGSVTNTAPSAELADLLLSVMGGLRVSARAGYAPERLRRTVDVALAVLDAPRADSS
jgi:TetR/AcrR family transcriptional repressor of nem operon